MLMPNNVFKLINYLWIGPFYYKLNSIKFNTYNIITQYKNKKESRILLI